MSIMQLKCSNTRPRRSEDLTDTQPRIPLRKNCVQALAQIFASYQHQNRSQNQPTQPNQPSQPNQPIQPNGSLPQPINRLAQKPPNPPNFSVPLQDSNAKSNRRSMNANQQRSSMPPPPRLVRIVVVGSDNALHTVVTGYPKNVIVPFLF
jgi:hypothetical protein